jgi:hypothetical protein
VTGPTKVLLVSGSLSTESVNSAVLRTAAALAGDRMSTTLYEGLGTLPHFDPDNDPDGGPVPVAVADLRRRLAEADAVPFCAPEHAGSLPGSFAWRRIQIPRTALGADGMIPDAAIQDEVATAPRTVADSAAPTSRPARPRTAPGPA